MLRLLSGESDSEEIFHRKVTFHPLDGYFTFVDFPPVDKGIEC